MRPAKLLVPALVLALPLAAQGPTPTPAPGLDELAWLAGTWEGTIGEDPLIETWFPPAGGRMAGLFRWVKGGEVYLYELVSLEETPEGVVLRIKHFGPDLVGWEAKEDSVVFDLVEIAGGRAVFAERDDEEEGTTLTFRPEGEDGLVATFEETRDGEPVLLTFRYERVEGSRPGNVGRFSDGEP